MVIKVRVLEPRFGENEHWVWWFECPVKLCVVLCAFGPSPSSCISENIIVELARYILFYVTQDGGYDQQIRHPFELKLLSRRKVYSILDTVL